MKNKTKFAWSSVLLVCLLLAAAAMLPEAAQATEAQGGNLMFILDASGSMWGRVEGRTKIDIAKEVMTDLIKSLPTGTKVGLVAYGHRRKGDCQDVEELVPLGPLNKGQLLSHIKSLSPKGKTPLILSVRLTAERLKGLEEETTIILVSDGQETCEGDPCALVKELKASGIKFVMHVIGFDVTDLERKQLQCLADAGGGTYYSAQTAREFKLAAKKAVETPVKKPEVPVGYLKLKAIKQGKLFSALVRVYRPGQEDRVTQDWTDKDGPKTLKLPSGVYDVQIRDEEVLHKPVVTFSGIELRAWEMVERTANFSEGRLKVTVLKDGRPFAAMVTIHKPGEENPLTTEWTSREQAATFTLLPGVYDLKVVDREVLQRPTKMIFGLEIKPGTLLEKTVEGFSEGRLKLTTVKHDQPFAAYVAIYQPGEENSFSETWTSPKEPAIFRVVPGVYDLKILDKSVLPHTPKTITGIDLKPGTTVDKTVSGFVESTLKVIAFKHGKPATAYVRIYKPDQYGEKVLVDNKWTTPQEPAVSRLIPGVYELHVVDRLVATEPSQKFALDLKDGETLEKTATLVSGTLKVTALKNGKPFNARARIYPPGEKNLLDSKMTEGKDPAVFLLLPGAYDLEVTDYEVSPHSAQKVSGLVIKDGVMLEKEVAGFTQSTLMVSAVRGGKGIEAAVRVFQAEDNIQIDIKAATPKEPATFNLLPGVYNLTVTDRANQVKRIEGVNIEVGQTRTIEATW